MSLDVAQKLIVYDFDHQGFEPSLAVTWLLRQDRSSLRFPVNFQDWIINVLVVAIGALLTFDKPEAMMALFRSLFNY